MIQQQLSVIENTPNAFTVYDCTGTYSTSNKGGYGPPNYNSSAIIKSILYIQGPSDTESYPYQIDVTDSLPNPDGLGLEIVPSQVGQIDSVESGQWKFKRVTTFTTSTVNVVVTSYYTVILTKQIQCCIESNAGTLDKYAFKNDRQKKIIELSNIFCDVQYQIEIGRYEYANTTIEYLKSQCKCSGC